MTKSNSLSSARIRKQLNYDLIGKDSYRGITLSYAYLANQTGHFALAFVPSAGIYYCSIIVGQVLPILVYGRVLGWHWLGLGLKYTIFSSS
jgi:glucokinase